MTFRKSIFTIVLCALVAFPVSAYAQDNKDAINKELDKYGIKPGKQGEGLKDEPKKEEPKKEEAKKDETKDGKIENKGDVPVVVFIKTTGGVEHVVQLGPKQAPSDPEKDPVYESAPLPADAKEVKIKPDPMNPGDKGKDPDVQITHPNGLETSIHKFGDKKMIYKGPKVYAVMNLSEKYSHEIDLIKEDGTKETVVLNPSQFVSVDPGVVEIKYKDKNTSVKVFETEPKAKGEKKTVTLELKDGSVKIPENKTISMSTFGDEFKNERFASSRVNARDFAVEHEATQSENE